MPFQIDNPQNAIPNFVLHSMPSHSYTNSAINMRVKANKNMVDTYLKTAHHSITGFFLLITSFKVASAATSSGIT
eukprot:8182477-Karenia_brevis.AAC.1